MKLLLQYLKKHRLLVIAALVMTLINQGAAFVDPMITGYIVDHIIDKRSSLSHSQYFGQVFLMVGLAFAAVVISRLANNFQDYYTNIIVQRTGTDMFSDGLKHSLAMPFFEFEEKSSGETMGSLTKVRTDVEGFITSFINIFFMALIGLAFVIIYSLFISFKVTLLYIIAIPLIVLISWYMSRKIKPIQENILNKNSQLAGATTESLRNIELVKTLGLSDQQTSDIDVHNHDLLDLEIDKIKLTRSVGFLQGVMINAIRCLMIIVLLYLIYDKQLSAGQFFAFLFYAMFLFNPFQDLGKVFQSGREAQASLKKLKKIIKVPAEKQMSGSEQLGEIEKISFKDIGFDYKGKDASGLKNISFEVKRGESIAFVGPSGSGKSTIIKLLVRLYDPTAGMICYNTTDYKKIKLNDIRQRVGIVTQDTQLFSGSIKDNLLFVSPESTDEDCISVLNKAVCRELLNKAGDNLDTIIGESGMKVSGGERQRLSIARALLRKPDLLIFDEATSALDSITEKSITETIQKITDSGKQISIIVSHRLSTVKFVDRIYVVEKGSIVEHGNHEQLVKKKGLYYAMWRQQSGEAANH